MSWICRAEWLAPTHPGGSEIATCDARGDTDRGAEKHTAETGHPTISGPNAAEKTETTR